MRETKKTDLRIALVCDWLTTPGGAEKVLLELHKMYPKAPIYTSQYRPRKIDWFEKADVRTGWLNYFPSGLRKILGPLRARYFRRLDLTEYDLVISVTGAEAKAVQAKKHICYCHVPTQYYWGMYDSYLKNPGFGILNPLARLGLRLVVGNMRKQDFAAAQRPTEFVTISEYAAKQIKKYYHREATVIAPPVDTQKFAETGAETEPRSGFIIAGRQVNWKRMDLAIEGCLKTKTSLTVIGDGAEHKNLVKLAEGSELIKFVSWVDSKKLAKYLHQAEGYIFPSLEPFGIAAVEALAAGCPVIALKDGGSQDFIKPDENGVMFSRQRSSSVAQAIREFRWQKWSAKKIARSVEEFDVAVFREKITKEIERVAQNDEVQK